MSGYIPADLMPAFLIQESYRLSNPAVLTLRPERLRQWVHRDKVKRGPAGYYIPSLGAQLERAFGRAA